MSMQKNESIDEIVDLLQTQSPDFSHIADLVYHANKSLGHTFVEIRQHLNELKYPKRLLAFRNFTEVIRALNSPNLFIDPEK